MCVMPCLSRHLVRESRPRHKDGVTQDEINSCLVTKNLESKTLKLYQLTKKKVTKCQKEQI